ncbi:hypothetical protein Dimus_004104 [Dionaea muscipula]
MDAVKEFYAKMSVVHLKKRDIVKSKVRGVDMEFDHEKLATILDTFLTMCKLTRENGIWWIGSGENRRRDDNEDAPVEEADEEDERNKDDFDWEAVIDEATVEGESGSGEKFYDAEDKDQCSPEVNEEIPATVLQSSAQQKEQGTSGVDPSCPTGRIPEAELLKFQAEFERKRANKFHADLEKAKAENARLLALLHQAQFKPNP